MTVTPCLGNSAIYDTALFDHVTPRQRYEAHTIAAALCARCPIATTCPDHVTPPANQPASPASPASPARNPKDATTVTTAPDITPPTPPRLDPRDLQPATAEALIAWGAAHPTTRVQGLAAKARAALHDLRQAHEREAAVAEAEARVKRLKAQLANAEQDLRAAKNPTAPAAKPSTPETGRPTTDELRAIRKWAAANGHPVAPKGLIARHVIEAYRAAHTTRLAEAS